MSYEIHFWTKEGHEWEEPDTDATVDGKIKIPIFSHADEFQTFMNSVVINKMDELEEIPVCGYLRVWEHGAGHKTVRIMKPLVLVSGSWGSKYKLCYSEDQLIRIVESLYPKVAEPLKIRISEDKKMDISRATHGPTEPKLESLEDVTMLVLNEDAQRDKAMQLRNAFDMGKLAFKSGLGDAWDGFLDTVQRKRREIEQLVKIIKDYVNKAPQDDVYISPYTKEVIAGCDAILEGCQIITSGHDHLLNRTHEAMLAKQLATSNK